MNSYFKLVKLAENWSRIKPDHHPIFPSQKYSYSPQTFHCNRKIRFGMPKNGSIEFEF